MPAVTVVLALLLGSSATPPPPKVVCSMPAAKRTKFVSPAYPEAAVNGGRSGTVVVEFVVTDTGKTADLNVKKRVAPDLDQAVLDAIKQWEYEPFVMNGKARSLVLSASVTFKLPRAKAPARQPQAPRPK